MAENKRKRFRPGSVLVMGFLIVILLGSALLSLPFAQREGSEAGYLDCLFVSTSAVCVTGLTTVDIADTFTVFGRIVVMLLVQVGGLGFASFALFVISLIGRNISFSSMSIAKEAMNYDSGKGIIGMVYSVLSYAFLFEILGTVLLAVPYYMRSGNILYAIGMGAFHSVSAFNNAGFDLNGGLSSLTGFRGDVYFNVVVAVLIILGGLGFFVLKDLVRKRKWSRLSFHTKIVLFMTLVLVGGGMLLLVAGGLEPLDAFFLSVSARTAGFSTIALESLPNSSMLVMLFLMFIGASPGSTGGGVKTTTVFVIFVAMGAVVTGREPNVFRRRISHDSIFKAMTVFVMAIIVILTATFGIMVIEGDAYPTIDILFEVVSAAATVGLSRSLTPLLQVGSRFIIMLVMFFGRLGPLTIVTMFTRTTPGRVGYIQENVLIG